jgi:hypothetical protein
VVVVVEQNMQVWVELSSPRRGTELSSLSLVVAFSLVLLVVTNCGSNTFAVELIYFAG